jgi:citrate lyase subunit beta/citryl-CoA lyase
VAKALASGAHAVIVDLEDAVAPAEKEAARSGLAGLFTEEPPVRVHIRVNALGTAWAAADLDVVRGLPVHGVVLPKTESAELPDVGDLALHCLIETPLGVERAFEIASHPRVAGVSLGEADLRVHTGAGETGLDWARSRLINAACAAGLQRPYQSVYFEIGDVDGLARSCAHGRELGFLGRAAIHPTQLPVIEQAYLPTVAEVAQARRIVSAAADRVHAAFALDGRLVDAPVVATAEQTVALAERYGTRA